MNSQDWRSDLFLLNELIKGESKGIKHPKEAGRVNQITSLFERVSAIFTGKSSYLESSKENQIDEIAIRVFSKENSPEIVYSEETAL